MAKNNSDGSKKIQSSSSTSHISSLSDELLVEILCRLGSSKYAIRCKCVCKRWLSLVRSANSNHSYFLRRWRKINLGEQPIALLIQYTLFREKENDSEPSMSTSEEEKNDYNNYPATNNSTGADSKEENNDDDDDNDNSGYMPENNSGSNSNSDNGYYSEHSMSTSEEENDCNYPETNNSPGADSEDENDDDDDPDYIVPEKISCSNSSSGNGYYSEHSVSTSEEENDYNYPAANNFPGADSEDENDDDDPDYIESENNSDSNSSYEDDFDTHHVIHYFSLFNKDLQKFNPLDFLPCNTTHGNDRATPIRVLASFKDLVLCCPNEKDQSVYYICNPFTRQWIALPPSPLPPGNDFDSVGVGLVVSDDNDSDPKFKVVRVFFRDNDKVKVEIFSSDDSSCMWRARHISLPKYWYARRSVLCYNGMFIWRSLCRELVHVILFDGVNACANTDANYTLLPLPVVYELRSLRSHVGVCMGCLRTSQLVYNNSNHGSYAPKLIIWELDNHSQDWKLVHELDFFEVDLPYLPGDYNSKWLKIRAFHPRDRDILYMDYVSDGGSLACICNVRNRTVELIRDIPIRDRGSAKVFPLQMPSWPTTIPPLSLPPELENRH